MSKPQSLSEYLDDIARLLRSRMGLRGRTLADTLTKARRRLPRALRPEGEALVRALPLMEHPRLSQTLDMPRLTRAATALHEHLAAIDLADRRKGWILNVLAVIAFNVLALFALFVVVLYLRGYF